jgi:two-component system, chemotaxis family, CheB/CheR fusion protein
MEDAPEHADPTPQPTPPPIVAIGASAGGAEAFGELLRALPTDTGMAFVLIQHLDPNHPSHLREVVARSTTMPVYDIEDGMPIEPDHVYVMPSHADVGLVAGKLVLLPRPSESRRIHLPIDLFFQTLAAERASLAIGVVLSGTGADGTEGLRAIKGAGGVAYAQAPSSAKFSGMPEAAISAGVVDAAFPPAELAVELDRLARHPFLHEPDDGLLLDEADLRKVLAMLRASAGADLGGYKLTTIRRRLARRMALHRIGALHQYVQLLRDVPTEAAALLEDILIHVTAFFRDPVVFDRLAVHVFPEIVKPKRDGAIRIWCAGCSTGEEAYSLLIALLEYLDREHLPAPPIQLFATDLSEKAIIAARAGLYSDAAVRELGPERIARFFTRIDGGGYRIAKAIRERCAFVKHDLARDPPFSRIDLVSCRNVLIYFGAELQQRVLASLHFALSSPGFLLLGRAETVASDTDLFAPVDKDARIYARSTAKSQLRVTPARDLAAPSSPSAARQPSPALDQLVRQAEIRLLDRYAPPGVIVNGKQEILRFRGRTGPYLEPAPGEPRHELFAMARPGLAAELRIALSQARLERELVRRRDVRVEQDGAVHTCDVVVIPMATPPDPRDHLFAVLFEDHEPAPYGPSPRDASELPTDVVRALEGELEETRRHLQSIIDEHQRTNDDLMSANEELVSANEELQSLNEELETAKEELQSTNEELSTLNEELQVRNTELDGVNSDLFNILGSVEVPIVIVDAARRIRRFTPKARPILNLLPADVGRPIEDINPAVAIEDLDRKIAEVIDTLVLHEEEVRGRHGGWYRLQIRPYTTIDKRIDGAVISLIDIDALKQALGAAEWVRDFARATVEAVQTPLVVVDASWQIVSANRAFRDQIGDGVLEGRSIFGPLGGDLPALRAALAKVIEAGEAFDNLETQRELAGRGRRILTLSGRTVPHPTGDRLALLAVEDITDRRNAELERTHLLEEARAARASAERANRAKDLFLAMLSHELRTPLSAIALNADVLQQSHPDDTMVQRSAKAIGNAVQAQARLIDDLLDISAIASGSPRVELQPIDLPEVVRGAAAMVEPAAAQHRLELTLELDETVPKVAGDPARLQQVVWNLLTNAIKFSPDGGRVTVTLDAIDGHARIRVSDDGAGIDGDFLPHVFEQFSRENRRSTPGVGLGLGIVRYIVEAHGGTVEAHSEGKGKGSTFTVTLPLGSHVVPQRRREPGSLEHAKILVIDDDRRTREALDAVLRLAGATVRTASSVVEGLTAFTELRPDLVVCDVTMPGEDGYSLIRRIRAMDHASGRIPAIALTGRITDDDRREAEAAGFDLHLPKPIEPERLLGELTRLRGERS